MVASDIADGSRGSFVFASSNQAANSRSGSSACVKSPLVNHAGCSIGADSDIARSAHVVALVPSVQYRAFGYRAMPGAGAIALALALSGCSFSYQLDSLFTKKEEGAGEHSGSLRLVAPKPSAEPPAESDLAVARAAASE